MLDVYFAALQSTTVRQESAYGIMDFLGKIYIYAKLRLSKILVFDLCIPHPVFATTYEVLWYGITLSFFVMHGCLFIVVAAWKYSKQA